jgi:hypothetical protein
MELGADGVLVNTAIAAAEDAASMAEAMKLAVEAGHLARLPGRLPQQPIDGPAASAEAPSDCRFLGRIDGLTEAGMLVDMRACTRLDDIVFVPALLRQARLSEYSQTPVCQFVVHITMLPTPRPCHWRTGSDRRTPYPVGPIVGPLGPPARLPRRPASVLQCPRSEFGDEQGKGLPEGFRTANGPV